MAALPPASLVYHLDSRQWEVRPVPGGAPHTWAAPPVISRQTLQAVSIRGGRSSHEEKDAWSNTTHLLLAAEPWSISRSTEFVEVEQLLVVLLVSATHSAPPPARRARVKPRPLPAFAPQRELRQKTALTAAAVPQKFVEHYWGQAASTNLGNAQGIAPGGLDGWSWCVGASLRATFACQDGRGDSQELHLTLCSKTDWTGNGRGKVGNACKRCCDGVTTDSVSIGSISRPGVSVRKCVWLKCCYGRRPFGGTAELPWSSRCEQQKKLMIGVAGADKKGVPTVKTAVRSGQDQSGKKAKKRSVIHPNRAAFDSQRY